MFLTVETKNRASDVSCPQDAGGHTHSNVLSANEVPPKSLRAILHDLVEALLRESQ